MLVLVFGSKGWIGQQFIDILKNNDITYTCSKSRCDNVIDLKNEINTVNPTHIIYDD